MIMMTTCDDNDQEELSEVHEENAEMEISCTNIENDQENEVLKEEAGVGKETIIKEEKEKIKEEIKKEVKEDTKEEIKEEVKEDVKEEVKSQSKEAIEKETNEETQAEKEVADDDRDCEPQDEEPSAITVNPDTPIGHDYVRQVVMFYCDLCHKYLPKFNRGDPDELIDNHCLSTAHQNAYVKKQIEEQEALKILTKEEQQDSPTKKPSKERITFNEDQLDYEAESVNGD